MMVALKEVELNMMSGDQQCNLYLRTRCSGLRVWNVSSRGAIIELNFGMYEPSPSKHRMAVHKIIRRQTLGRWYSCKAPWGCFLGFAFHGIWILSGSTKHAEFLYSKRVGCSSLDS